MRRFVAAAMPVLALLPAAPVQAEKADREKQMFISADDANAVEEKEKGRKEMVAVGNVVITQGTLRVDADRATVVQSDDNSRAGVATGSPVKFRQKRDDGNGFNEGEASRVEFDERTGWIRFFNNVKFKIGKNEVAGEYATYNSETEEYSVSNGVPGKDSPKRGQVQLILPPPSEKAKSSAGSAKPEK